MLFQNIMSREEKSRTRSRMGFRDNRLLSEMLNNLAKEELKEKDHSRITLGNDVEENISKYKTVTTQMFEKKNKPKLPEQMYSYKNIS